LRALVVRAKKALFTASTTEMPSFELIVLGSGGGPLETNLSAYLFHDYGSNWSEGIIGLEAGSGLGALTNLLTTKPDLFGELGRGFARPSKNAAHIMDHVHTYLITHAHLDHIASLVLSAGSHLGDRQKIISSKVVLEFIETAFQDRVWPNLVSYNPNDPPYNYLLSAIDLDNDYHTISPTVSIRCMPLSHGKNTKDEDYPSLAYFVRHKHSGRQFLFFGDVEPDSVSCKGTTRAVWREAAPLIADGYLTTIFLECSWLTGRPDPQLFGHLTPPYFVEELQSLAKEVISYRESCNVSNTSFGLDSDGQRLAKRKRSFPSSTPLNGLKVYVIHCKEPSEDITDQRPISQITATQIERLLQKVDLGVEIIGAESGMRIMI